MRAPDDISALAFFSPTLPGEFGRLWLKKTVAVRQGSRGSMNRLLGGTGEGNAGGGEPFPLSVVATWIDTSLSESGIREYAGLASMSNAEADSFRSAYLAKHDVANSIFIWAELETSMTEDFLKLDRWTIFLENDIGREVEPARIVEHPVRHISAGRDRGPGEGGEIAPMRPGFDMRRSVKTVEFYFPLQRDNSPPFIIPTTTSVKLVFLDAGNNMVRAEGSWVLHPSR
jgi:hypothetical protein